MYHATALNGLFSLFFIKFYKITFILIGEDQIYRFMEVTFYDLNQYFRFFIPNLILKFTFCGTHVVLLFLDVGGNYSFFIF
jgi:hypothetical protein